MADAPPKIVPAVVNKPPAPAPAPLNREQVATAAKTAHAAMDDNIVAMPLNDPDFTTNVKPKNPDISLRWVLYSLGMRDGTASYLRFEKAKTQGYVVATAADLVNPPMAYSVDNGTKFVNGDLVLMKIDRRRYLGAILHREQAAAKAMASTKQAGREEVHRSLAGAPTSQRSKISTFSPTEGELKEFLEADPDQLVEEPRQR